MLSILFSILCSTGVLILFKTTPNTKAITAHLILVGYAVSVLAGLLILPVSFHHTDSLWLLAAAIEGIAFYLVFHLMARSAQLGGIAFTGLASKMSVVIPVTIGLVFLGDSLNMFVVAGVLLGLAAVILSAGDKMTSDSWRWPLLVFLGTGTIDASFKLFQVWGLSEASFPGFIVTIFGFALLTGALVFMIKDRSAIRRSSLVAGVILGLLNLGSVHFLMKALAIPELDSTVVYALNSFGIVFMSLLVAVLLFKERFSIKGYSAMVMAVASILVLYLSYNLTESV